MCQAGYSMGFATVGGITLHYALDGVRNGLPLIFVNSLGTDLRIWDGVVSHFADDCCLLRYDKRGHGLSDCPAGPYTIHDHVADLAALIDAWQIETAVLVGISVGGLIAMGYAAAHPERIRALALCDTATTIGTAQFWNERIETLRQKGMDDLGEAILARWFAPDFARQRPADYRGYYHMLTRTPLAGYIATCEAIRDADMREAARTIKAPTLVLCGSEDVTIPPDVGQTLAGAIADARFAVVLDAGHLPCIEQSAQFAGVLRSFLQEIGCVQ